jgi:hypothetical protein
MNVKVQMSNEFENDSMSKHSSFVTFFLLSVGFPLNFEL